MSHKAALTFTDRAERHRRIVSTYQRGLSSREVAAAFGINDSWVRSIVRLYGVARKPGRPVA